MTEEPMPCPFCGSDPTPDFCSSTDGPAYLFHCQSKDCPAWPNVQGETEAKAIAAWNTRAALTSANVEGLVDALKTARDSVCIAYCKRGENDEWEHVYACRKADKALAHTKEASNG